MRTILKVFLNNELLTPGLYIDPNTGGMLFQLLAVFLALFSGILFFFSRQIRSAFARLRRKVQREQTDDKPESTEDQS
jgi:hypothetical protein